MPKKKTNFEDSIERFRAPRGTKARIEALARKRRCLPAQVLRDAVIDFLERNETASAPMIKSLDDIPNFKDKK